MNSRSLRSKVTFVGSFQLAGDEHLLPPGTYEVLIEEELLEGLSFEAYRRTGTYLMVDVRTNGTKVSEMRSITMEDLDAALLHDRLRAGPN